MKQRIIMALVALHSLVAAFAGNIVAGDLTMKPGETKALEISLAGTVSNVYGIQFEVRLPEGFSFVKGKDDKVFEMAGDQVGDITCKELELGDDTYRFVVYSASLQQLQGGRLMTVNLKASDEMQLGSYPITIENVVLSDYDGHVSKEDGVTVGVKVTNYFTLSYMVDGEYYNSHDVEYGAIVYPDTEPTKEGYTFSGWSEIPETMPDHDVTVTGTFTVNKYKVTYMLDGVEYKTIEVEYGASIPVEAEPSKEGYTFSGWDEVPKTMPAKDVTVTGSFAVNKYKLIYIVDGQQYKSYEVEFGATITPEAEPAKEGYTFSGWEGLEETMPASNVVVTGSFTMNSYTLTYQVDGEDYKTYKVEYGTAITPEAEPAPKEGYTFSGWSELPETMPAHDVTITGKFTANKYVLIYLLDGKEYKTVEVDFGSTIVPEAEPAPREGYTFSGWSGLPETMPAQIVIVTGTFTVNKYKLTYMIGDEKYKEVEVEYGATIPTEPQPDGDYVQFEWVGIPETMPAHDVIVYADFETGIMEIMALRGVRCIYSPNGKRISKLQKGLNIVVMNDGSVKKVYLK